mmetsp:Transcript_7671/g.18399  ORF Transcript_7671/g.18399 Transcript_7671/m.18399 type:complete len:341 (+) Transcript_7671:368-1390(+)
MRSISGRSDMVAASRNSSFASLSSARFRSSSSTFASAASCKTARRSPDEESSSKAARVSSSSTSIHSVKASGKMLASLRLAGGNSSPGAARSLASNMASLSRSESKSTVACCSSRTHSLKVPLSMSSLSTPCSLADWMHCWSLLMPVPSAASRNSNSANLRRVPAKSWCSGSPISAATAKTLRKSSMSVLSATAAACIFRYALLPVYNWFSVSPAALPSSRARSSISASCSFVPSLISPRASLREASSTFSSSTLTARAASRRCRISFRSRRFTAASSSNSRIKRQPAATSSSWWDSTTAASASGTKRSKASKSRASTASAISKKTRILRASRLSSSLPF